MLRVRNVEELAECMLAVDGLVSKQESRSADFAPSVDRWLRSVEQVLEANRLHQAGVVAMLRSSIVAVKQGQVPLDIQLEGRRTRSRLLHAVASRSMQKGVATALEVIEENRPRIEEAARVGQQIAASALSRGLIPERPKGMVHTEYLRLLRQGFAATPDLEAAVVHLEGLVGPNDALMLLDRALSSHLSASSLLDPALVASPSLVQAF